MKKFFLIMAGMSVALSAQAFKQETHKQMAIDAVNYMRNNPSTTNYAQLSAVASAAGYTVDEFAQVLGQGAYDVDDFADTYICGAVTGDCVQAPVFEAGASIVKYTSYWHFQNHTRGADVHGNDIGGYNYSLLTRWGTIDTAAATWLHNDFLDDGPGGRSGTLQIFEGSEYNSYGITEANYRQGSTSTNEQYADFQTAPFQPIDNLGNYWYGEFITKPTAQTLGFVMHTTDLLQPHHVWTTSDLNHSGWESWVQDHYSSENLNSEAKVTAALASYTDLPANTTDVRPLLTEGGAIAYSQGGDVLDHTDHATRLRVANVVVPHAIAMNVKLLNEAVNRMSTKSSNPFENLGLGSTSAPLLALLGLLAAFNRRLRRKV